MGKYPFTSDIVEETMKVPELDLTNICRVKELGIRSIKDFSEHPDLIAKYHNTYMIVFYDGSYTLTDCAESQLNCFIKTI